MIPSIPHRIGMAALACLGMAAALQTHAAVPGNVAYVTNQYGGVTVLDTRTLKTLNTIAVGSDPRGVAISPDGRWLYTANQGTSDLSVVDTGTGKEVKRIPLGKNPEFLRVSPDGHHAFATYEPSSEGKPQEGPPTTTTAAQYPGEEPAIPAEVAVVDLDKNVVIGRLKAAPETEGLEFSRDGKLLLVANEGDDTVAVFDIATLKKVKSIDVSKFGSRPRGIKASPDGKTYAVTLETSDNLLLLDANFNPIKTIKTGGGPYGVAYDRDGSHLWVAAARRSEMDVFDTKDMSQVADFAIGSRCWHFTFTPDDSKVLLACGRSDSVQVIDPKKYAVIDALHNFQMPWGIVAYPKSAGSLDTP